MSYKYYITSAECEVKDSRSSGIYKVASGGSEVASECPEVASELVRDIFEFFDLFFQGKKIIITSGRNIEEIIITSGLPRVCQ